MIIRFVLSIALLSAVAACKGNPLSVFSRKGGAPAPVAQPSGSPTPEFGQAARKSKENAELLNEMFRVVLLRDPASTTEFGSLVDTLNQGASFEGIYNGFTHSHAFRKLEFTSGVASAKAVQVFADLVEKFGVDAGSPAVFAASAAKPLPEIDTVSEVAMVGGQGPKASSAAEYQKVFANASIFTLKRLAGDEALRAFSAKNSDRERLASWYSKWVVAMAARGVDFGIEQRNRPDEKFHHDWALKATEDRIVWEILNRVHRVLNAAASSSNR